MVFPRINIIKITVFVVFFVFFIFNTINITFKNSLQEAILPENYIKNSSVLELSEKTSNIINVIFKAESEEEVNFKKEEFIKNFSNNDFEIVSFDIEKLYNFYSKNPVIFLSDAAKQNIKAKNYDKIYENALINLYSPTGTEIVPVVDDPYFLFGGFINQNIENLKPVKEIDGNFYTFLNLRIKNSYDFSSKQTNKSIKNLIDDNKDLMFSGSMIHSYYTSKNTSIWINIICILTTVFIVFLNYFCFKNIKPFILMALSILFGFLCGLCILKLVFGSFHIITLLFATALIGMGIDYSFHYFYAGKVNKDFIKKLSLSYFSTALAFGFLYLSGIDLLKQISLFMIFGLLGIYLFVLFIFPCFELNLNINKRKIELSKKIERIILIFVGVIIVLGVFGIKFDDNLSSLYVPNKSLKQNEIIYNKITNSDNSDIYFLINKADSIQELLEKEEKLNEYLKSKNIKFNSISKFIPSNKTQKENILLVRDLYKNNLNRFLEFLSKEQIEKISNKIKNASPLSFDDDISVFNYFILDKNKFMTVAYANNADDLNKYCDEIINIKKDISNTLKQYRIALLKLLPFVYVALFIIFTVLYGFKKGTKMTIPIVFSMLFSLFFAMRFFGGANLFTIIALFLIAGFTVDYSVFRENNSENSECAVFVSMVTTSFSFLLLSFTSFKLISSMALVLFFGIVSSYFFGTIVLKKEKQQ